MKYLLFIPTINEEATISNLIIGSLKSFPNLQILVIDDNSSDGTVESIEKLQKEYPGITLICRPKKLGIGSAHTEAISYAIDHNFDFLLTMDGDGSHGINYLREFIFYSNRFDLVIGSRYLNKDSLAEWKITRIILTRMVHLLTQFFLNLNYDCSSAFRCYRIESLPNDFLFQIKSRGYDYFFESVFKLHLNGNLIKEIPVILPARTYGHSKLSIKLAFSAFWHLLRLSFSYRISK